MIRTARTFREKDRLFSPLPQGDIDLCPEKGFVYIQRTVAYSELSHTPAFDQPHVFKVGYSHGSKLKDSRYFMAKSFQVSTTATEQRSKQ